MEAAPHGPENPQRSPLGVQACKTCINEGHDTDLETGIAYEAEAFGSASPPATRRKAWPPSSKNAKPTSPANNDRPQKKAPRFRAGPFAVPQPVKPVTV
jgi:hypothetical protein